MEVQFGDHELERLETDPNLDGRFPAGIPTAFRKRMQAIRSAPDERTFYALRSWRFEKLKGKRRGQCSIRLNDQYRLIVEIVASSPGNKLNIVSIEDYHR